MEQESFWSLFRKEFFPTFDEETEKLIKEKKELERLINQRTQVKEGEYI
jgi:hypothetical protein